MPRTVVAFLRAVNVGGRRCTMDRLRAVCSDAGLADVRTHLASGNVIFRTAKRNLPKLETELAAALERGLGFDVDVFLRTGDELRAVAAARPFPTAEMAAAQAYNVGFLTTPLGASEKKTVAGFATDIDAFAVLGREVYWLCRRKQSESGFSNAVFERALKRRATFRNLRTVEAIVENFLD